MLFQGEKLFIDAFRNHADKVILIPVKQFQPEETQSDAMEKARSPFYLLVKIRVGHFFKAAYGFALLMVLLIAPLKPVIAETSETSPDAAVAQTVNGILSYSRWPDKTTSSSLTLCIIQPVKYAALLTPDGSAFAGRPLKVMTLPFDSPLLTAQCDAIYSGRITAEQQNDLHQRLEGHAILTISEEDETCGLLNAFCLVITPLHTGFKLNLDTLSRSGVRVNPAVLQLAREKE
ncbi:YfiR family protein [Rahnella aquatilis]|nr:YfiR family protein [Rahnella aquatilis]MBU9858846.1 YfiR family protein [Rahnella aceris]AZP43883.1 YfiR family protein [Rahnella aquatilis]AZP48220.1 YfiR family protein [Rahnella aquatilis]AZP52672.1 YfiR family protein [Rahnella aquatilis]